MEITRHEYMVISFALEDYIEKKLRNKKDFPLGMDEDIIKQNIKLYDKIEEHNYELYERARNE